MSRLGIFACLFSSPVRYNILLTSYHFPCTIWRLASSGIQHCSRIWSAPLSMWILTRRELGLYRRSCSGSHLNQALWGLFPEFASFCAKQLLCSTPLTRCNHYKYLGKKLLSVHCTTYVVCWFWHEEGEGGDFSINFDDCQDQGQMECISLFTLILLQIDFAIHIIVILSLLVCVLIA